MSQGASDAGAESAVPEPVKKAMRTVTPPFRGRPDAEMTVIGTAYFLGLVILLIPLLPFLVIVWLVSKAMGVFAKKAPTEQVTERLPGR